MKQDRSSTRGEGSAALPQAAAALHADSMLSPEQPAPVGCTKRKAAGSLWQFQQPHLPALAKLLHAVVELGGDEHCALALGVHALHDVQPQAAAPLHAALLQEQDQPAQQQLSFSCSCARVCSTELSLTQHLSAVLVGHKPRPPQLPLFRTSELR